MIELGIISFPKLALAGASAFTSYLCYRQLPIPRERGKLRKVFDVGKLHLQFGECKVYPKIHAVKLGTELSYYVFSIPFGLDPDKVHSHKWLFEQKFGRNLDISQEGKKFVLTVYHSKLPSQLAYDYETIQHQLSSYRLPIVVGQSRTGFEAYEMTTYPHLLIAGETGSGKSTQLRSIITTLLLHSKNISLYLADLKRSEFHLFRSIENVEVVTDKVELSFILSSICGEMKQRGDLFDSQECTSIDEYNGKSIKKMKYILLCIDEVALLQKDKVLLEQIEEISAIGRALGVFLILSMQRPDSKVLDGKLKNNLTVRMAFRHSNGINSRITIDSDHAAGISIKDRGRMYFKCEELKMVQGPFLSVEKARSLLAPLKVEMKNKKPIIEQPEFPL